MQTRTPVPPQSSPWGLQGAQAPCTVAIIMPPTTPRFSPWRPYPDPRARGILIAPLGPGVYELRRRSTGAFVLVGIGSRCALRMTSLLPRPLGSGGRNNSAKRKYLRRHLADIEYRTLACATRADAAAVERKRLRTTDYIFRT